MRTPSPRRQNRRRQESRAEKFGGLLFFGEDLPLKTEILPGSNLELPPDLTLSVTWARRERVDGEEGDGGKSCKQNNSFEQQDNKNSTQGCHWQQEPSKQHVSKLSNHDRCILNKVWKYILSSMINKHGNNANAYYNETSHACRYREYRYSAAAAQHSRGHSTDRTATHQQ